MPTAEGWSFLRGVFSVFVWLMAICHLPPFLSFHFGHNIFTYIVHISPSFMEQHRFAEQSSSQTHQQAPQLSTRRVAFDPWRRVYAPWMAEFLGTMLFVLFSDLFGTLLLNGSTDSLLNIVFLESLLLLGLILIFGPFSGGHFNPAITIGSILSLGTPILLGFSFLLAQFLGAFIGALLFHSVLSNSAFLDTFSRLGVLRVLPTPTEGGEGGGGGGDDQRMPMMVAPQMLLTNGLANDGQGFRSPFAGRFQIFLIELLGSTLLVLAFIFPALLIPRPKLFSVAFSSASARSVASSLGSRSPLGQCANLARALANSLLAAIFTRAEEFAIWRLFHLHLFAAISSPIVAAAIFWVIKYAVNVADRSQIEGNLQQQQRATTEEVRRRQIRDVVRN